MKLFEQPKVFWNMTPWGKCYEVHHRGRIYESSCDGTLWNERGHGYDMTFRISEKCRRAVRRAEKRGETEELKDKTKEWDELLARQSGDFRAKVIAGGLEGQANARKTGLLP